MICATAIAIAFLKYWTPFVMFKMHYDRQERLLDALGGAVKPPNPLKKIVYVAPDLPTYPPPLPLPDLPPEPETEPVQCRVKEASLLTRFNRVEGERVLRDE
jgi:hypothetical protein